MNKYIFWCIQPEFNKMCSELREHFANSRISPLNLRNSTQAQGAVPQTQEKAPLIKAKHPKF